jgi:iron-sulfur cluster repair protein YtfE (RIC family)
MPESAAKDACDLLDADHIAVKHLFVEYARLAYAPDAPANGDRAAVAMKICNELTVHAQIEEEIFYPALRKAVPAAGDLLDEAQQEHQQARNLVSQIREMGTADATMDQLVAELARAIEHHVKEERDELFPKAKSAKGMDLAALGQQLKERQQELEAEMATT